VRISSVDLRAEAIAEVRRLAGARALLRDGDEAAGSRLEADATWVLVARRTKLRQALGGRACLIWRVTVEEAAGGRTIASRIVPLLVELTADVDRRSSAGLTRFLSDATTPLRARVEAESQAWRADVVGGVTAFASARLSRELGYRGPASNEGDAQPGLFDRRAERSRAAAAATAAERDRTTRNRIASIRATTQTALPPPRLLLVIVP
jgi:hypothetical protein